MSGGNYVNLDPAEERAALEAKMAAGGRGQGMKECLGPENLKTIYIKKENTKKNTLCCFMLFDQFYLLYQENIITNIFTNFGYICANRLFPLILSTVGIVCFTLISVYFQNVEQIIFT